MSVWASLVDEARNEGELERLNAALLEIRREERRRTLSVAADLLEAKFGMTAVPFAEELRDMVEGT